MVIIIASILATGYFMGEKDINVYDAIDYIKDVSDHMTRRIAGGVEGVATAACTTLIRTEVEPIVTHRALADIAESVVHLRCADFNCQYSTSDSIRIRKTFITDWLAQDGFCKIWMRMDLSVPVIVDISDIRVDIVEESGNNKIIYTLPSPMLGQPRVDFDHVQHCVNDSRSLSNGEIALLGPLMLHSMLLEGSQYALNEAFDSSVIEDVKNDLSTDIYLATQDIYPGSSVEVWFTTNPGNHENNGVLRNDIENRHNEQSNEHTDTMGRK
ncbi:MAG: hypothetical protein GF388_03675 [Candidatus Aegiribacteria sp.]|nr:hypothetical protein [Candidatus Aegiribacteria sp.]